MKGLVKFSSVIASFRTAIKYVKPLVDLLNAIVQPFEEFADKIEQLRNGGTPQ